MVVSPGTPKMCSTRYSLSNSTRTWAVFIVSPVVPSYIAAAALLLAGCNGWLEALFQYSYFEQVIHHALSTRRIAVSTESLLLAKRVDILCKVALFCAAHAAWFIESHTLFNCMFTGGTESNIGIDSMLRACSLYMIVIFR